jgi:prepilin-type N-terminal cleavage/methylation domain-containing protein
MRKPLPPFKRKAGFTLVEVAIAAVVAGVLATAGLYQLAVEMRYQMARSQVDQLKVLAGALKKYQGKYGSSLLVGTDVPGVSSDMSPTVAELKTLKMLDDNFSAVNLYSSTGGYSTKIRVSPSGCTGSTCSLFGLAYLNTAVLDSQGRPDSAAVGEAMAYGGGDVAVSTGLDKTKVSAYGGLWSEPSPLPTIAGIMAIRVTSEGSNEYVPLNGSEAMTGSLKMGANDITGVRNFVATGDISGNNVNASGNVAATNVSASSTVSGTNVTASNTVSGTNVTASNTVSGTNVTATNTVSGTTVRGTNVQATNNVTATNVQATGTVSGNTISGSTVSGTTISGSTISGTNISASNQVYGNTVSASQLSATNANISNNISAYTANISGGATVNGNLASHSNWWSLILRNGSGTDNAQVQNGAGSAYVNDIFIRSTGKWASQLGGGYTNFYLVAGPQICSLTVSRAYCPAGTRLVSGGYTLTAYASTHNSPDSSFPDVGSNAWYISGSGSTSCFVPYAMCAN